MNNLSWMLYLADVAESASFIVGMGTILLTTAVVWLGFSYSCNVSLSHHSEDRKKENDAHRKLCLSYIPTISIIASILFLVFLLLPTKQTIYLIAASEMGETMVEENPEFNKVREIINRWLDDQIE